MDLQAKLELWDSHLDYTEKGYSKIILSWSQIEFDGVKTDSTTPLLDVVDCNTNLFVVHENVEITPLVFRTSLAIAHLTKIFRDSHVSNHNLLVREYDEKKNNPPTKEACTQIPIPIGKKEKVVLNSLSPIKPKVNSSAQTDLRLTGGFGLASVLRDFWPQKHIINGRPG